MMGRAETGFEMVERRPVFLSSCFQDPIGSPLGIRQKVADLAVGRGRAHISTRPVWMAEDFPSLRPESSLRALDKAEFCLDGVRECECVVVILSHRHGSSISFGDSSVPSSFFELELFEAALLGKPTRLLTTSQIQRIANSAMAFICTLSRSRAQGRS
jgi:hypothetical protein